MDGEAYLDHSKQSAAEATVLLPLGSGVEGS